MRLYGMAVRRGIFKMDEYRHAKFERMFSASLPFRPVVRAIP